jgi:diadenosine tetraphosphate (Ap4A) HIT family hydrolase
VARKLGLAESGYRLIANTGVHGHQEVPHYHMHILGGQAMGKMVNLPAAE